jgi:hypothetical protein
MRRQLVGIILDVLFLVASLGNGGGVADGIRVLAVVVGGVVGGLVVIVAAVFAMFAVLVVLDQRRPPYPMV